MSRVVLFSTSTCSWCRRAKRYFRERRVPFKEINVDFLNHYTTAQR
jgi:glutaredoxin 3